MPGWFGMGETEEERKKYAGTMGLLGLASSLLEAGAPSTNPASGNFGAALGKGIQGGMAGMGMGANQLLKQAEANYYRQKSLPQFKEGNPGGVVYNENDPSINFTLRGTPKTAVPKITFRDDFMGGDGNPHLIAIGEDGNIIKDYGRAYKKEEATGNKESSDRFFADMLTYIKNGGIPTDSMKKALETYMEAKRVANPLGPMIDPTSDIVSRLFPKKEAPTAQPKPLTPEIAAQYLKKYGNRAEAEKAAKADGYSW